jgi:hypothetical protein
MEPLLGGVQWTETLRVDRMREKEEVENLGSPCLTVNRVGGTARFILAWRSHASSEDNAFLLSRKLHENLDSR